MPILESIKEAETKAELIINEANNNARELLEKTKTEANLDALALKKQAKEKILIMNETNNQNIEKAKLDIINRSNSVNKENQEKALKNAPQVIDMIVKKVLES